LTRSRLRAAGGSLGFVVVGGPTIVAGLVPWLLTHWHADDQPLLLRVLGGVVMAFGLVLVLESTARFALEGHGTPAPWAPPERFVVHGLYRFTRNPMYVGVLALVLGQALLLGRQVLFAWAAAAWLIFQLFLVLEEEPGLRRRFGTEYDDYRARVPRWFPIAPRSPRYSRHRPGRPGRRSQ